jgi:hypothetical protein
MKIRAIEADKSKYSDMDRRDLSKPMQIIYDGYFSVLYLASGEYGQGLT